MTVAPPRCAGAIVEDERTVLTAAHCIAPDEEMLPVALSTGDVLSAAVAERFEERDVAVLVLAEPAGVEPLRRASALPEEGDALLYAGRLDRAEGLQAVLVEEIGPCPDRPEIDDALFTTLEGQPGDSGAPLLNLDLDLVALVHGGVTCEIAVPVVGLPVTDL